MTSLAQQKLVNDILEDNQQLERGIASAVSSLMALSERAAHMAAYLCTDAQVPGSAVTVEYLAEVSSKLTLQREQLQAALATLDELHPLIDPDPTVASAALASLIAKHGCSPATFTDRYR